MNKLVEYLYEHHSPMGGSCEITQVSTILKETDWTREQIYEMALEGEKEYYLWLHHHDGNYSSEQKGPSNLTSLTLWNTSYRENHLRFPKKELDPRITL